MSVISVIVPVYNVSSYIEQCLYSLTKQTLKDIDIIIVDDCGTDDSITKIRAIAQKDKRIKIICNPTNQGLAESRNIGLRFVNSKYVAFLDSDDWVDTHFYEKLYITIEKEQADIAVGDVIYYHSKYRQMREGVSKWNFHLKKRVITSPQDKQFNIYSCACWNKLYRTDLFKKYNLKFPKGLYIEDVPITFITTVLSNKIAMCKAAVLYYRMRRDSIMATARKDRKPFDIFKIYDYIDTLWDTYKHIGLQEQYRQILDNFKIFNTYNWYSATSPYFKEEFYKKMREIFSKTNISRNPYITRRSRQIYNSVHNNEKPFITIKLFKRNLIKCRKGKKSATLWLFDVIPLCAYKF